MSNRKKIFHIARTGTTLLLGWILCILSFPATTYADNFPFIGTLHAGNKPEALAVDSQTHMLYIAYESPGVIVGFDPLSGNVRWRTKLGDSATDVQVDSISHRVFAASTTYDNKQTTLSMLDGATGNIIFNSLIPFGDESLALDSNRQRVYVASGDGGIVNSFTFISGWQNGPVRVDKAQLHIGSHPQALGVNSHLGRLYVADGAKHQVTVIDEDSGNTIATILVGEVPLNPIRIDEATGRVYIVCSTSQELDVIDGNSNRVIAHPRVIAYPEGVAFDTATNRIYVGNEGDMENSSVQHNSGNSITVIDGHSLNVLGTLRVGLSPDGIMADPDLHRIYVSAEDSNAVVEISDSPNLAMFLTNTQNQLIAAGLATTLLQQATTITLFLMIVTFLMATLFALLRRWREQEIPQTRQEDVSSDLKKHSLPL